MRGRMPPLLCLPPGEPSASPGLPDYVVGIRDRRTPTPEPP
jgi:hypothetical protein